MLHGPTQVIFLERFGHNLDDLVRFFSMPSYKGHLKDERRSIVALVVYRIGQSIGSNCGKIARVRNKVQCFILKEVLILLTVSQLEEAQMSLNNFLVMIGCKKYYQSRGLNPLPTDKWIEEMLIKAEMGTKLCLA